MPEPPHPRPNPSRDPGRARAPRIAAETRHVRALECRSADSERLAAYGEVLGWLFEGYRGDRDVQDTIDEVCRAVRAIAREDIAGRPGEGEGEGD